MKETVNVNIASQAFTLDDDAYAVLRQAIWDDSRPGDCRRRTTTRWRMSKRVSPTFSVNGFRRR